MVTDINSEMIAGGPRLLDFQWEEMLSPSAWAAHHPLPISWFRPTLHFLCSSLPSLQSSRTSDAICKPHRQGLSYTPEPAGRPHDRFKLEPFRGAAGEQRERSESSLL